MRSVFSIIPLTMLRTTFIYIIYDKWAKQVNVCYSLVRKYIHHITSHLYSLIVTASLRPYCPTGCRLTSSLGFPEVTALLSLELAF